MGILERHADKWEPTAYGCWVWTGAVSGAPGLRPQVRIGGRKGKTEYVARLVCEEIYGSAPLLHEAAHATRSGCIGGLCVAPHHLRWATSRENSQDIPPEVRTEASRKGAVTAGKRMYNLPRNVSFDQRNKKYKVVCKEKFVGYYYTIDEAVAARDKYLGVN